MLPCGYEGFFSALVWTACAACKEMEGVGLREGMLPPCGHEGFFFDVVWAAFAAGGRGGLLGAAPLRGPLCTPPGAPAGLSLFHRLSRAARLLLRELPSLRSGDLPPRRATPSATFPCMKNSKPSGCRKESVLLQAECSQMICLFPQELFLRAVKRQNVSVVTLRVSILNVFVQSKNANFG